MYAPVENWYPLGEVPGHCFLQSEYNVLSSGQNFLGCLGFFSVFYLFVGLTEV